MASWSACLVLIDASTAFAVIVGIWWTTVILRYVDVISTDAPISTLAIPKGATESVLYTVASGVIGLGIGIARGRRRWAGTGRWTGTWRRCRRWRCTPAGHDRSILTRKLKSRAVDVRKIAPLCGPVNRRTRPRRITAGREFYVWDIVYVRIIDI